jgi:hypothetical protein
MLGGMLAGHEESGGTVVEENGEKFMLFYGMSSESAMTRHVGGVAKYRAAEGKTVKLPLRGPVENTARDILGGLRSACTYVGASRLKELTNVRRLFAFRNRKTAYSIACNGSLAHARAPALFTIPRSSHPQMENRQVHCHHQRADNDPVTIRSTGSRSRQIICR